MARVIAISPAKNSIQSKWAESSMRPDRNKTNELHANKRHIPADKAQQRHVRMWRQIIQARASHYNALSKNS